MEIIRLKWASQTFAPRNGTLRCRSFVSASLPPPLLSRSSHVKKLPAPSPLHSGAPPNHFPPKPSTKITMTTISPPSSSLTTRLTLLAFLSATTIYFLYKSRRLKILHLSSSATPSPPRSGKLFFISQTGTAKTLAQRLHSLLTSNGLPFDLTDPADYEPEDLHKESLVLIVASTWEEGKPPSNGKFLSNWLEESADDFRVGSLLLSKCKFALFGVGSRVYGETFNAVVKGFSKRMRSLGGTEVLPVWEGDVDGGELDEEFDA